MPAVSTAFAVGVAAVLLTDSAGGNYTSDYVIQNTGAADVFIGGADVTVANGIRVGPGQRDTFKVNNNRDELYAIAAAAGGEVRVLRMVE
jgi:hypothetical protein